MNKSLIVQGVFRLLATLNYWYEHSLTHAVMVKLHRQVQSSFLVGGIYRSFTQDEHRDYSRGSLIVGLPLALFAWLMGSLKRGFGRLPKALFESSFFVRMLNSSVAVSFSQNLPLSVGCFLLLSLLIPSHLWSNLLILLAAVVFWFIYLLGYLQGTRPGIDGRYVATSLLVYVLFALISFATGFGGMDSIRVFSIMAGSIAIGLLLTQVIEDVKDLHLLAGFLLVGMFLSGLFGLLQYFVLGIAIRSDFIDLNANVGIAGRLYATMGNPNNYAKVLTMFLPVAVGLAFSLKNPWLKWLVSAMLVPVVLALVLTFSRAAYLALGGSVFFFVLMKWPRLVPLGVLAGLLAIPFLPEVILMRLGTIGTDTSSLYRVQIWEGSWRTIQNYWASGIGIGPGAFTLIYRAHAHNMAGNAMHAHNVLLNVWAEVGIAGALAMLAYNFTTVRRGIVAFINTSSPAIKYYLAGGVSSLVGFLMFSMVEHVWFYPRAMLSYFVVMGLIWACVRQHERS